mgnify:CR=1 FL=1
MKKLTLLTITLFASFGASAWNSLNLDKQVVTCPNESGGYTVTAKSSASDIISNCKVTQQAKGNYVLEKSTTVQFNAVVTTPVVCEFDGKDLDDCKFVK